ncbi:hypothetical protein [Variovorax sp. W1I1]|uniref:hypothetical protein n=1 Tax=Variovorax sp. W1I1 TaxID=3042309 RepID=UPI0027D7BB0A|nr:hypothetical protein [Variovorax sp. W1I1]
MNVNYAKLDQDNEAQFVKQMEEGMKAGAAERTFFSAGLAAHQSAITDGLMPSRNEEGDLVYSPQQGMKAACHAREDAAAILNIQLPALKLLHQVRLLLCGCLAVLAYIAYRVS